VSNISGSFLPRRKSAGTALFLMFLMLSSVFSAANDSDFGASLLPEPDYDSTGELFFHPAPNQTSVNSSLSSLIQVPSNHTFMDGSIEIEPLWNRSASNGTHYGVGALNQWNGTHSMTNGIGHGGQLTLATNSSLGTITDFESTVVVPARWLGSGDDHEAWSIQRPSIAPFSSNSGMALPTNGSNSIGFLATQARGDIGPDMNGCFVSPTVETPFRISNYTLQFEHWTALYDDDAAWVEIRDMNGSWATLSPLGGYSSASVLNSTPGSVWNGEDSTWNSASFQLDTLVAQFQPTVQFRLCFQTSSSSGLRGGWFVDNFEVRNQGDSPGAWFHGNLSADYAPNADGDFVLPVDFSNLSGQNVELEVWSNWDIQGAAFDTLTIEISYNNGLSYNSLSNYPGLPSVGAVCNGQWFNGGDSANRWCPFTFVLPWSTSTPANASSIYLRFNVQTNNQINYGGSTSSAWEGIAIDDLGVWVNRGTTNQSYTLLHNFTAQPTGINGSVDGWLESRTAPNEWQWLTFFEHNSPQATVFDFDSGNDLPAGWSLWSQTNRRWEVGATSNSSGFGPGVWHSGLSGAGIYLDDEYRSDMWTELFTPEYYIPENSTSRLTFRSWVCTEANWDGGAVSISTDGGENWWFIPPTYNGFHDQLSTTNIYSPLYNQAIFDGSRVVGGCHNVQRGFDLKEYDLSNLTGSTVRAKFTFFSDQLVELDGWYIDDAGIEIDVYEPNGTWTSEVLTPDPLFGWGQLDGFVVEPSNTTVRFDVLDANGTAIAGYQNRTLPIDLPFDVVQHPELYIRVHMTSLDRLITPSIERLSIGALTYFDAYHLVHSTEFTGTNLEQLETSSDFTLRTPSTASYVSLMWDTKAFCPFQVAQYQLLAGNLTAAHSDYSLVASKWEAAPYPVLSQTIERQGRPKMSVDFALTWSPGQSSKGFLFEPYCSVAPIGTEVGLGTPPTSLFSWPESTASSTLGLNQHFHAFQQPQSPAVNGFEDISFSHSGAMSSAQLSVLIARNRDSTLVSGFDISYLAAITSDGSAGLLRHGNLQTVDLHLTSSQQHHRIQFTSVCSTQVQYTEHLDICTLDLQVEGNFTANFSQLHFIPHQQVLTTQLTHQVLNSLLNQSYAQSPGPLVALPLHVQSESGSQMVNLSYTMQTKLVDRVLTPVHVRWLPKQTIQFETHHWRGDAHSMDLDGPDLSSVSLALSAQPNYAGQLVEVEVYNLDSTPQFRQLSGAGYASLEASLSLAQCTMNTCSINWSLTSHWLMDDVDDLYVLAKATDVDGFSTGPDVEVRQTSFNEVENDLEVVDFNVIDDLNRVLDDWSNPQWPFHLNASQEMVATGKVRFEGIANAFVESSDAEIRIDATAVPPMNLSGGTNEWPGDAVDWSASWFGDVDSNGAFSIDIQAPGLVDAVPSNTRILLSPHVHRTGPVDEDTSSSEDQTNPFISIPFLFDKVHPTTVSIDALESGDYVPVDGLIWTAQQDIALRLTLQDPEGLSNSLQLYTWLESSHDANGNGIMEANEYSVQTVTFNSGLTSVLIDLPLLPWQQILPAGRPSGTASIVVKGFDLAGNPLEGGGQFGEALDLATFEVQERYDTTIDTETVSFDLFQSQLLPGNEHTFAFKVIDGNGIESFDFIEFALLSREQSEECAIKYEPRFQQVEYDEECFVAAPVINASKHPLLSEWQVEIHFRMSWNLLGNSMNGTPSLKIFDEGQDLGLGLSRMSVFNWTLSRQLELSMFDVQDQTLPLGTRDESKLWVHKNDTLSVNVVLYHANTSIAAEQLPDSVLLQAVLSDGERSSNSNVRFSLQGQAVMTVHLDPSVVKLQQATLEFEVMGLPTFSQRKIFNITFDSESPRLSIPPGILSQIDSNALDEVDVILMVNDEVGINRSSIQMHWYFTRAGMLVDGSQGAADVGFLSQTSITATFSSQIDIQPSNASLLMKNDRLVVWFSGKDQSGNVLSGFGTEVEPVTPNFRWIAFEPQFENIVATPYRAKVGEQVSIFVRVSNIGVLPGNVTVECYDDEGILLETNSSFIEGGSWVDYLWEVEAWKTGRLGLTVKIVNHTGNVPVSMANVDEYDQNSGQTTTALGFAVLVVLLSGGIFVASILRRREQSNRFIAEQVHSALDRSSLPPPRPKDLVELTQEE